MLQIVKKTYGGVTVGYVVGWWFHPRCYGWGTASRSLSFRSIREGLMFPSLEKAQKFRDKIEKQRADMRVKFEKVE